MRWLIFIIVYILVDIYSFQAFRTTVRNPWLHYAWLLLSLAVLAGFIYQISTMDRSKGLSSAWMYTLGIFLAVFVPKLIIVIVMFGEDIVRTVIGLINSVFSRSQGFSLPERRKFLSTIALGLAAIPFAALLYGMYRGKYRYRVLKYQLEFDDLPKAFDGYRITQVSDIHSGSFDNHDKVAYGVNLINEQKGDVILFTGDLVNNVAAEMKDYKGLFAGLMARDGVYSVLGNHDYGDYVDWDSAEAKEKNLDELKDLERAMGWDLLLNENRKIEKDGQAIHIVGVENWGAGFKQVGDLDKASRGLTPDDFKILMSHDPSHWQQRVKDDPRHFQLTLSGHTHGMQFGIEIPGFFKWSPVQYRYENWAGIYNQGKRIINVNRGFGYLAYPGRVGIWPEITVIELKKKA
ncbi:MAG: phosphoesterase [Cytophagaceae bacterium]|nr:phosphoesterase [Cytophagaceae bacterium]|tara:strand:- start:1457 stop:2671 length:1215 start_codon:yes stop_codon:yes gene_type:complete